jgi:hypothetical protein
MHLSKRGGISSVQMDSARGRALPSGGVLSMTIEPEDSVAGMLGPGISFWGMGMPKLILAVD